MTAIMVWNGAALLGEGPCWDPRDELLWFVDIKGRRVHRYDPQSDGTQAWDAPAPIGWVLPAEGGVLLAGLQTGLARFDPATGDFTHLAQVEPDLPGNRLNDATVAPDGSVWFDSMDDGERETTGRVHRWNGRSVETSAIEPVVITNGPGVSPDGRTLYHVDTLGGIIHAVALLGEGATGEVRTFARIDPADGHPDGVTVDSAGNVWVGLWGGWRARLYDPEGGIVTEVGLPAANITKVALGGPDGRTAYATSARVGLSAEALAAQPEAGNVFSFAVETPGQRLPLARLTVAG